MSELIASSYGKANVKFLKVKKNPQNPEEQEILEANVQCLLKGAFDVSYTKADNSPIVPTDTVKNTILIEAKNTDVWPIERFAAHLAKHFTSKYSHISAIEINIVQSRWIKYPLKNGKLHAHSFRHDGPETRRTFLTYEKASKKLTIKSSIKDLTVLKSTGSMFYGYNVCDYTTLQPTTDRILSTDVFASWTFDPKFVPTLDSVFTKADEGLFDTTYEKARATTLELFALEQSASVQATMYNMSHSILEQVPELLTVDYELPNKHYILFNLEWKGIKDNKELFYPSPDPNGLIRSTVGRKSGSAKL
ncbi:peroxisomal urate oxidase [Scheffersomyces xylosifermentans]|uniref:peroxisomal urate oxidase n=1 Tax=Scheffersomyces xylosifermentans TaxID=1304137 RepID=UPI00315D615A